MTGSLIYPGEYTPLLNEELLLQQLTLSSGDSDQIFHPKVNMDEYEDYYKLEVRMPGIKRSEIVIYIHDNILSVAGKQRKPFCSEEKELKIHEFDTACFQRHIFLSHNADTAFISAEFRKGILHLHIPKSNEPVFLKPRQVIVY